jgi:hypothetical protein
VKRLWSGELTNPIFAELNLPTRSWATISIVCISVIVIFFEVEGVIGSIQSRQYLATGKWLTRFRAQVPEVSAIDLSMKTAIIAA